VVRDRVSGIACFLGRQHVVAERTQRLHVRRGKFSFA
jgi:hypothetical protein